MSLSGLNFSRHFVFIFFSIFITIAYQSVSVSGQRLKRFDDIKRWAVREENIVVLAKARVKRLKSELSELESYVEDYEKTTSQHISGINDPKLKETRKASVDARAYHVASDPLLTYRMTHRLTTMLPKLQRALLSKDLESRRLKELLGAYIDIDQHPNVTFEKVGNAFGQHFKLLPIEEDLEGALDAITVLYDVYNPDVLNPSNFVKVLSPETSSPSHINAYHATKFSLKAFYHGYYGNALDWANYAHEKLENERDYSVSEELVHYMKEFMRKSHNEESEKLMYLFPDAISYLNCYVNSVNDSITGTKRKSDVYAFQSMSQVRGQENPYFSKESISAPLNNFFFYSTCQKSRLQKLGEFSSSNMLTCFLKRDLYHFIPIKVERLSVEPKILQYHDFLSDRELNNILGEVMRLRFQPSYKLKQFPDEYGTRVPHLRTAMDADVEKQGKWGVKIGSFKKLARKIEYLTGFKLGNNSLAGFKVSEFVGGGYDAFSKWTKEQEQNTKGGIQIFLKSPEAGGELVFGGANAIAIPTKGSAVVWENTEGGSVFYTRESLLVGSCPVLQGQKLVLSKDF